jgi:hypothetical protein
MIGRRNVAALCSLVLLCAAAGCTNHYEIPIETPIQPRMDITPFSRIFVAGFISGGTDDVDANMETVRLLRSQLRSRSELRVVEAEVLPLADLARDLVPGAKSTAGNGSPSPAPVDQLATTSQADGQQADGQHTAAGGAIRTEKDLEAYQVIFQDEAFWRKVGEQHQNPLIVTGTVLFTNTQTSGFVTSSTEVIDPLGRRSVQPTRVYMERKGFIIEPRFIFIDGRTGAVLHSDRFHEEVLYPAQQNTPALSSYFELMDRLIPSFLGSLSAQRIRGTRVLLK